MYERRALEDSGVCCWDLPEYGEAQCGCFGGEQHLLLWNGDTRGNT